MYWFNLKTTVLLIIVTGIHGPFLLADEQAGHGQTQDGHGHAEADRADDHTHTQAGRVRVEPGHAHTAEGYEYIEEITVTADPLGDVDAHLMMPVRVLGKDELETRSIRNIGEAVANELGVSTSDFGTAVGRPVIRGLAGSRVGVLENGISTMDVSNIGADHAVPTEPGLARQVEIFKGPATLLFGSGASGGVVNVVNDRILKYVPDTLEGDISLQYETVSNGVNGSGSFNAGAGNFAFHLDGMKRYSRDYDIPGYAVLNRDPDDEMEKGVLENSSIKSENVSLGVSWVGERGFMGFAVSRLDSNYGILGGHHHGAEDHFDEIDMDLDHHDDEDDHENGEDHEEDEHHEDGDDHDEEDNHDEEDDHENGGDHEEDEHQEDEDGHEHDEADHGEEEGRPRIDLGSTRYDFEASAYEPFSGIHRIRTRWTYTDYNHDEVEGNGDVAVTFLNEEVGGRVEIVHHPLAGWQGAVGIQYHHKDFSAVGEEEFVLPSELESIAAFVLEKNDLGKWHMEFSARYEHQDTSSETGDKTSHDLFSLSGGLNWGYHDGYELGLIVTHAQRAPSLEELYSEGPHLATVTFEYGDSELGKEKSTNIDLYWHKTAGMITLTANLFYNRISDFIFLKEQDLNGDGIADWVHDDFAGDLADILGPGVDSTHLLVAQVQEKADFMGFELEGVVHALHGDYGALDVRLWADYVEGERSDNVNLPRITPWRYGAGMTYFLGPWYASVSYTRVNNQNDTAPFETSTRGYDDLNLYASYRISHGGNDVTLFASASNLLDEEKRRHTSFVKDLAPMPGRSGIFGVRVSF